MRCLCGKGQWRVETRDVTSKGLKNQSPEKMERVHGPAIEKGGKAPIWYLQRKQWGPEALLPVCQWAWQIWWMHLHWSGYTQPEMKSYQPIGSTGRLRQAESADKKLNWSSVSQKKATANSHSFNVAFFSLPKFMVRDIKRILHGKTVINCQ